jgi:hypothetical protein
MEEFRSIRANRAPTQIILDNIDRMHEFANQKYEKFAKIWTQFDQAAFACGIAIAFWLFLFHSVTSFGISKHQQTTAGLVGFTISLVSYAFSMLGYLPLEVAGAVAVAVSFG